MRKLMLLSAGIVACFASQAFAQTTNDEKYVGIGARARPAYEGADTSRVDLIPYLRLYGEHFFVRTTQGILEGGWRTRPFGSVVFGAQLAYEAGRISDESAFLKDHHFGDVDPSASFGVHAEGDWKFGPMPLNALLRYRHDIDSDNGAQVDLRATAGILDWRGARAGLYGQLTWGDAKSTQKYFGITPQQSIAVGLAPYSTGSGIRNVQFGLIGDLALAEHWIALWGINLQQVQGDARGSPIVQEHTNWHVNAGVAYRF